MELETFKGELARSGYTEMLERHYEPNAVVGHHTHPFAARALVTAGELVIACAGEARTYRAGDIFELAANQEHTETYGPAGASYFVGRKYP